MKLLKQGSLRFLDASFKVLEGHRPEKELQPFDSSNSNVIKRGNATLSLESALRKSCAHRMQTNSKNQVTRLLSADYPETVDVVRGILQRVKRHTNMARMQMALSTMRRPELVPFGVPHYR